MEESKVFRYLWRFNAIVIATAGFLAILALFFTVYMIYNDLNRNTHRNEIVNIDPDTNIEETFRLGRIEHVKGTQSIIVPLYSDQSFSLRYSGSKSTASTRNLLFSNMQNETNTWLLPNSDYLITSHRLINESNSYDKDKTVITIFYQIVKADTNNDSRLTGNDKLTLALSDPEGNNYTEIIMNVDQVLGYDVINKHAIAIIYSRENIGYAAYIDLTTFTTTKEIELPKLR